MGFFGKIFGNDSKTVDNNTTVDDNNTLPKLKKEEVKEKVNPVMSLESEYLNAKREIKSYEEKYDDYIVKSLESEFEDYKRIMEKYTPHKLPSHEYSWFISESKYNEIKLEKYHKTDSGRDDKVSLTVHYKFDESTAIFSIDRMYVSIGYQSTHLKEKKFNNIIQKYFMFLKVKEVNRERDNSKSNYDRMVNMVGRDVKRDAILDQLLGQ